MHNFLLRSTDELLDVVYTKMVLTCDMIGMSCTAPQLPASQIWNATRIPGRTLTGSLESCIRILRRFVDQGIWLFRSKFSVVEVHRAEN